MRPILSTEPTRYEILATHPDGRRFLVAYAGGSPSRSRLLCVMRERGEALIAKLGIGDEDVMTFDTKPRPRAMTSGWTIAYTGRTQREVRGAGHEAPFIGAVA